MVGDEERAQRRRPDQPQPRLRLAGGPGELRRLFFTSRPSELQLNRRQRIRELLHLSRLADAHSVDEFRDPASVPHRELVDILQRLAR